MKKQRSLSHSIISVGVVTVIILMVPFVAMQFTDEVQWSLLDFATMGTLIFSIGIAYRLIIRSSPNFAYQIASTLAFGAVFLMVWANLAVGLIGSGANLANVLYMVVPGVAIVGAFLSNSNPGKMERSMYATVIALAVVTLIALLTKSSEYRSSPTTEILAISGFFFLLFIAAALIFRLATKQSDREPEKSNV